MKFYFQLQYVRLTRFLKEAGVHPFLALLFLVSIFLVSSQLLVNSITHGRWMYILLAVYVFTKIRNTELVGLIFPKSTIRKLRIYEAVIFSVPFSLFLFLNHFYLQGILLLSAVTVSSLLEVRTSFSITIPTPFNLKPFEFIVGFRKTWILVLLLYALCLIALSVGNYNLSVFSIVVICIILLGYYTKPEHPFFVWVHKMTPNKFLANKAKTVTFYYLIFLLPPVVAMYLVFPQNWLPTTIVFLIGYFLPLIGLLNKYAYFPNNSEMINGILLGFCILFPPLLLFIIPYLMNKASINLKHYL